MTSNTTPDGKITETVNLTDNTRETAVDELIALTDNTAAKHVKVKEQLGINMGTGIPTPIGDALIGYPITENTLNHLTRLFIDGEWMLNKTFASEPEYIDIHIGSDCAVIMHSGSIFSGTDRSYLYVNRDHFNEFFVELLSEPGSQLLWPPGGRNVEWRNYPAYDCLVPTVTVQENPDDPTFSLFAGFDDEYVTKENIDSLVALPTVTECIHGEYKDIKQTYEETRDRIAKHSQHVKNDSTNREGIAYSGMHVDDPSDTFEQFFTWCMTRNNWSVDSDCESPLDVLEDETSELFCPLNSHKRAQLQHNS